MPTVSLTKSYEDGTDLTEQQLDDLKDSIETALNTTKLDSSNIQTAGISSDNLATNSVTTAKITSGACTTSKIADDAITADKIADSAVGSSQIAAGAVTPAKRAARTVTTDGTDPGAGGISISTASGELSSTSSTYADATNLSVTLTTLGNPVFLGLIDSGAGSAAKFEVTAPSGAAEAEGRVKLVRDSTDVSRNFITYREGSGWTGFLSTPLGILSHIDTPTAGTYTYKVQFAVSPATAGYEFEIKNAKLVAYELI